MLSTEVPSSLNKSILGEQKNSLSSFYAIMKSVQDLRVIVILIAVGHAIASHAALFFACLGLIHAKQTSGLLLIDRLDSANREEFYETPKIHGISTNEIRFMEADRILSYTLFTLYSLTALATIYAIITVGLLIGVIKRRCELILPWMLFQTTACSLFALVLLLTHTIRIEILDKYMKEFFSCYWDQSFIAISILFLNILCLLFVLKYYQELKMLKRITQEVIIPIPYRVVPFHFRKENMHVGSGRYKHLLSDSNPNYVI